MQRLFSAFPTARPGFALFVLRVALSVLLLDGVLGPLDRLGSAWVLLAPWSVAVGLWLGFLTPVVTVLCIIIEFSTWLSSAGTLQAVHICAILDAFALTLLGPGAYSLDARLFGRRKIVFPPDDASQDK
jgi:hypothetical protein